MKSKAKIKTYKTVQWCELSQESKDFIRHTWEFTFKQDAYVETGVVDDDALVKLSELSGDEEYIRSENWCDDYVYVKGSNPLTEELLSLGLDIEEEILILISW